MHKIVEALIYNNGHFGARGWNIPDEEVIWRNRAVEVVEASEAAKVNVSGIFIGDKKAILIGLRGRIALLYRTLCTLKPP